MLCETVDPAAVVIWLVSKIFFSHKKIYFFLLIFFKGEMWSAAYRCYRQCKAMLNTASFLLLHRYRGNTTKVFFFFFFFFFEDTFQWMAQFILVVRILVQVYQSIVFVVLYCQSAVDIWISCWYCTYNFKLRRYLSHHCCLVGFILIILIPSVLILSYDDIHSYLIPLYREIFLNSLV